MSVSKPKLNIARADLLFVAKMLKSWRDPRFGRLLSSDHRDRDTTARAIDDWSQSDWDALYKDAETPSKISP